MTDRGFRDKKSDDLLVKEENFAHAAELFRQNGYTVY